MRARRLSCHQYAGAVSVLPFHEGACSLVDEGLSVSGFTGVGIRFSMVALVDSLFAGRTPGQRLVVLPYRKSVFDTRLELHSGSERLGDARSMGLLQLRILTK